MSEIKKVLADFIQENRKKDRPLSAKSITAYSSTLLNLYNQVFGDLSTFDINNFNDYKTILDFLKDVQPNLRKTKLAALLTITTNSKAYIEFQKQMNSDLLSYKKLEEQNKLKDDETLITQQEIKEIGKKLKSEFDELYKELTSKKHPFEKRADPKKTAKKLTPYIYNELQQYILYLLTSGEYIEPRRLLDWTELKIGKFLVKDKDKKIDHNIYDPTKGKLLLSIYKTADTMGNQIIDIKDIKPYLTKWIKINELKDGDYLLTNIKGNPLNPIALNQRLNNIYGKHISVNNLRHSYITETYNNMPTVGNIKDKATKMGHGLERHLL